MKNAFPSKSVGVLSSDSSISSPCNTKSFSVARLPKITIPVFDGKYTQWTTFRDLFLSLIHNNVELDDVQRLHYLKTLLAGEAMQLIRHIPITQDNYEKCWDMLRSRYDNKRFMSNCIFKRLFQQRNILVESASGLKQLLDVTTDCLHELSNLGIDISTWDVIIIYIISLKLDVETRKQWELHVNQSSEDLPSFKYFSEFLETRFRALEFVEPQGKQGRIAGVNISNHPKALHVMANLSCPHCSEDHKLFNCKKFAREDVDQRRSIAKSLGVCYNCLGSNHINTKCRVFTKCRICRRKHHTLLHPKTPVSADSVDNPTETANLNNGLQVCSSTRDESNSNIATHFVTENVQNQGLLATALIKAEASVGYSYILRALIDQGSQASFITESAVQSLHLKKIAVKAEIAGLGGGQGGVTSRHMVRIKIQSLRDPTFNLEISAYVLSKVTSVLPERKFSVSDWPKLRELELADPEYNTPNKIDILLGAIPYSKILKEGLIKDPRNMIIAQNTYLGWIVSGEIIDADKSPACHNVIVSMHSRIEENELLKKFWEMEAEPLDGKKRLLTPEEQACEDYFAATIRRDESGRYVVSLPFNSEDPPCKYGNTRDIALKRLFGLERKLSKNAELKKQYSEVMNEYLLLGHMEKICDETDIDKADTVYLPHHAVIREDKTTTRTRVVFDASAKGTNGISLNDTFMVGPTLQADLRHTVMRWRRYPICMAADIVKMYRQIKVVEEHLDFQRVLWRNDVNAKIETYRLLRVTFGTSCAPYLAVKALQQIAHDEGHMYPLAAQRVLSDFFMDDLMTGCESEKEAIEIYVQLNELLNKAGFTLQKWTSNRDDLLRGIIKEPGNNLEIKVDKVTKVLGLTWDRSTDQFHYTVRMSSLLSTAPETKRKIISEISRLFDPLGWIAPCIVTSKVFIQKLWIAGLDWDDELPPELLKEWTRYRHQLQNLVNFQIPRWLGIKDGDRVVELHGFADASSVAYAAVIYCRVIDCNGQIQTNLVTAKTKVAPIKQCTIPRLELCAAVLTTRLLLESAEILNIPKPHLRAWTDSTIVLAWLSDHPSRWKTFVANRTSYILGSLDASQWGHVKSQDNPADVASRGINADLLMNDELWQRGPQWLSRDEIDYKRPQSTCTDLEKKSVKTYTVQMREDESEKQWARFSSLRRMVRVLAYCRRFLQIRTHRKAGTKALPYLTASEIQGTLNTCIKKCQQVWFPDEIKGVTTKGICKKSSVLVGLNPFIDANGMLRVGGRIQNSNLVHDMKHPVILPPQSHLTKLIVADAHERVFHGGTQLTLNFLRTKYWIIRAKNLVKAHIHECAPCIRYSGVTRNQLMGRLPKCRVTPSKPFLHTGVDYAGPIQIRTSKGRGHKSYKGYICLFICMATRAVHLEAVSDLTSQGFLAAFKRFVARRGHCGQLWSDNGTNFVGAAKELKTLFNKEFTAVSIEIASILANNGTEWRFIPPHAPNFGGLWEAGIKSTKHHLKRVIGESTLTFEEMSTVLSQIEACLNSRPLCAASSEPDDPTPLTPGHFLVGEAPVLTPDDNYEQFQMSNLRRWQMTQRMVQCFWRRWSQEYLTMLSQRYKWTFRTREPKIGDVVLVKEDNLPPAKWCYGRVVDIHPGADDVVRVVSLKCKDTIIKRPISKLCLLPSNPDESRP